jgi:hypothetical protein
VLKEVVEPHPTTGVPVPDPNTVVRALHDLGLAAWFRGSLMGTVGLNRAAEEEGRKPADRAEREPRLGEVDPLNACGCHQPGPPHANC